MSARLTRRCPARTRYMRDPLAGQPAERAPAGTWRKRGQAAGVGLTGGRGEGTVPSPQLPPVVRRWPPHKAAPPQVFDTAPQTRFTPSSVGQDYPPSSTPESVIRSEPLRSRTRRRHRRRTEHRAGDPPPIEGPPRGEQCGPERADPCARGEGSAQPRGDQGARLRALPASSALTSSNRPAGPVPSGRRCPAAFHRSSFS